MPPSLITISETLNHGNIVSLCAFYLFLPWFKASMFLNQVICFHAHLLCKENGPLAHLLWILVFDDQHNQIGLMDLQVIVL